MRNKKGAAQKKGQPMSPVLLKQTFNKFSGNQQVMNDEQLFEFLTDALGMAGDDPLVGHITANIMDLKKIDQTRLQDFAKLFDHAKASSVDDLKSCLPALRDQAKTEHNFRSMYKKIFPLYTGTHTTMDLETAEQLWIVYLKDRMNFFKEFQLYMEKVEDKDKVKVHKDLWNMMLEFCSDIKDIKKDYKEEDGWPVFIDSFAQFVKNGCQ